MRALNKAWAEVGRSAGGALTVVSQFNSERLAFGSAHPDMTKRIEGLVLTTGEYVAAIAQHLLATAIMFEGRQTHLSVWPLVRAELEIGGRVAWLLAPESAGERIAPEQRVARFQMEALASACRERYTAARLGDSRRVREAKSMRESVRSEILSVFVDAVVDCKEPGSEQDWIVAGERYSQLGATSELFAKVCLGDTRGLYDVLSDYSHPSLFRLRVQSEMVETDRSGVRALIYTAGLDQLAWQAMLSCVILYKSAHLVAGYFGLDARPLELWADSAPVEWFSRGSA